MTGVRRILNNAADIALATRHAVTCPRSFPVLIHGRTYYVTCDRPHGHDAPCSGRATDWGAPTL